MWPNYARGYAETPASPVLVYFRKDKYITFGKAQFARLEFDAGSHAANTSWAFTKISNASLAKITSMARSAIGVK